METKTFKTERTRPHKVKFAVCIERLTAIFEHIGSRAHCTTIGAVNSNDTLL